MKTFFTLLSLLLSTFSVSAKDKVPQVFADYLEASVAVKGAVVVVVPPKEIQGYIDKVQKGQAADPTWFEEFSKNAQPGVPLPYDEKLGLTEKEYKEYLALWDARKLESVPKGEVIVRLEPSKEGAWMIRVSGLGSDITTMRYHPEQDTFTTTSGTLKRIEDIDADDRSILGGWTGKEWKMEMDDGFGTTKENFAIGKLKDNSYGLIVYRIQEVSSTGRRLYDKSMILRFALKK